MIKNFIEMNETWNKAGMRPTIKDLAKQEKKVSDLIIQFGLEAHKHHKKYEDHRLEYTVKDSKAYHRAYHKLEKYIGEFCAMCRAYKFRI